MSPFNIGHTRHAVTAEVDDGVAAWERDGTLISNEVAVAIAGWFSSPAKADMPYTVLAQSGKGDVAELGAAILRDQEVTSLIPDGSAHRCLLALDAWVAQFEQEVEG